MTAIAKAPGTGGRLGYFPMPFPDELFHGALTRLARLLGASGRPPIPCGRTYGNHGIYMVRHLEHTISQFPPNHPLTPEIVRRDHTLAPFFYAFHEDPKSHPWIVEPTHLYSCKVCRAEDETRFGVSYWHRSHQIPNGRICHRHALPLQRASRPYQDWRIGRRADYFCPDETGWQDLETPEDWEHPIYSRFHERCQRILRGEIKLQANLKTHLLVAARQAGLCKGTRFRRSLLLKTAQENVGHLAQTLFQIPVKYTGWYDYVLSGSRLNTSNVLFLFEILSLDVEGRLSASEADLSQGTARIRRSRKPRQDTRRRHRATMENFIRRNPNAFRKELMKMVGTAYVWLHDNDKDWLEKIKKLLPSRKGRAPSRITRDATDSEAAELVKRTAALIEKGPGIPVSIRLPQLLRALAPDEQRFLRSHRNFPKTRQALAECRGSSRDLARRRLAWATAQPGWRDQGWTQFLVDSQLRRLVYFHPEIRELARQVFDSGRLDQQ